MSINDKDGNIVVRKTEKVTLPATIPTQHPEFTGFTLEEIKHQRALIAVRKEFAKARLLEDVEMLKDRNPFAAGSTLKAAGRLGSLPLKIMKGLNYTDYIMLGVSAFGSARKIFSLFRKKKK